MCNTHRSSPNHGTYKDSAGSLTKQNKEAGQRQNTVLLLNKTLTVVVTCYKFQCLGQLVTVKLELLQNLWCFKPLWNQTLWTESNHRIDNLKMLVFLLLFLIVYVYYKKNQMLLSILWYGKAAQGLRGKIQPAFFFIFIIFCVRAAGHRRNQAQIGVRKISIKTYF